MFKMHYYDWTFNSAKILKNSSIRAFAITKFFGGNIPDIYYGTMEWKKKVGTITVSSLWPPNTLIRPILRGSTLLNVTAKS